MAAPLVTGVKNTDVNKRKKGRIMQLLAHFESETDNEQKLRDLLVSDPFSICFYKFLWLKPNDIPCICTFSVGVYGKGGVNCGLNFKRTCCESLYLLGWFEGIIPLF